MSYKKLTRSTGSFPLTFFQGNVMINYAFVPVVKRISRRPPEPEVGVRLPAGTPEKDNSGCSATAVFVFFFLRPYF